MTDPIEILHSGRVIDLVRRGRWEFASRKKVSGVVGIIAVTDGPPRKLLLVEQYRPPVDARTIELPARLAGDQPGEESEEIRVAAVRELEEETGYRCGEIEPVAVGAASAGLCDEIITLFLARNLTRVHDGPVDHTEGITLHEVPVDQVPDFVYRQRQTGKQVDLKIYSALYFAASQ